MASCRLAIVLISAKMTTLTYSDDHRQNIHEGEKFDSKNKCIDEISQRQCINNGQQSCYRDEHRLSIQ